MGLREWIVPTEKEFFVLFEKEISIAVKGAETFRAHMGDLRNFEKYSKQLKELEKASDGVVHDIYVELGKTFITPFDQTDIAELASTMDDIIDQIEAVAMRIQIYKIEKSDEFLEGFADVLVESTKELESAIKLLRKRETFGRISKHLIEINRLENIADELQRKAITDVFKRDDAKRIIQLKECYDLLEDATDTCETVSHLIEDIIIRNG